LPQKNEIYTVDRFEGDFAILIGQKNQRIQVQSAHISALEGDKVQFDGRAFVRLPENGERAEIKARMDRLFKRR